MEFFSKIFKLTKIFKTARVVAGVDQLILSLANHCTNVFFTRDNHLTLRIQLLAPAILNGVEGVDRGIRRWQCLVKFEF